jgi:Domain of unknown function (DUF4278)
MFNPALNASNSTNTMINLIYRGINYEVSQQRVEQLKRTTEEIVALAGKELIYRGNRYQLVPAGLPIAVKKVGKHLIYRGATYQI